MRYLLYYLISWTSRKIVCDEKNDEINHAETSLWFPFSSAFNKTGKFLSFRRKGTFLQKV